MPSRTTQLEKRLRALERRGWTGSPREFRLMLKHFDRPAIIVEGDSWVAYPPKALITTQNSNVFRFIRDWTGSAASMLHVASNGDEASAMTSGAQKLAMAKRLAEFKPAVIVFSGGGNDVVGEFDMVRMVKSYRSGMTAADCIHRARWNRKAKRIELAHRELLELCEEFSPDTVIVTHAYDIPFVTGKQARFWKHIKTGPWIKPFLGEGHPGKGWYGRGIPEHMHRATIRIMFNEIRDALERIADGSGGRYRVAETQGLLDDIKWWRDELHPTSAGFKRVAKAVYGELRDVVPGLPAP